MTEQPIEQQIQEQPIEQKKDTLGNEIYVGNKPFMKYVVATMMQLQKQGNNSATIKARGKFISRAVDIAEVVKKRVKENDNIDIKYNVEINTDSFKDEKNKDINISTIALTLTK